MYTKCVITYNKGLLMLLIQQLGLITFTY